MKLSCHPRFHACPSRAIRQLKALSPPFAQSETQPTTALSVVGCATGSARLLSAHNWGGLLSLYRGNVCVLTRLYFDRSYRLARTPGGIHLRLLGRYKHVAMWPTSQNSVNANFAERPKGEVT